MCVTSNSLFPPAAVTSICVTSVSVICMAWLVHACHVKHPVPSRSHDLYVCDLVISVTWHDWFVCMTSSLVLPWPFSAWRDSVICVTWLVHMLAIHPLLSCCRDIWMCAVTHLYVQYDSSKYATLLDHVCDIEHHLPRAAITCMCWRDSVICTTWLVHMFDIKHALLLHSFGCHDLCMCVTWRIRMRDVNRSNVWHWWFMCMSCLSTREKRHIHVCVMTRSHVWQDSYMCTRCLLHMCHFKHPLLLHRHKSTYIYIYIYM